MFNYFLKRILLLPLTLFSIFLINFIILNLAPGDPTSTISFSPERKLTDSVSGVLFDRHLNFREHYGLTLPTLLNFWPWISREELESRIDKLVSFQKGNPTLSFQKFEEERLLLQDQARYQMGNLLEISNDLGVNEEVKFWATTLFIRGGIGFAKLGVNLNYEEKNYNLILNQSNSELLKLLPQPLTPLLDKPEKLKSWYEANKSLRRFEPTQREKWGIIFFETRFWRYFSRILTLDFGSLRNDPSKTVINEVLRRIPISITIVTIPLILSFIFCQFIGFWMAYKEGLFREQLVSLLFLILYSVPIFVAAPFLIEWVGLKGDLPIHGFSSPERTLDQMTSLERLFDYGKHLILPLIAVLYGGLASQARLTKHLVREVSGQDFIRSLRSRGIPEWVIASKHISKNVSIVLVTALAGSLGSLLGGSLVVETIFEINGFGKFFYDAIINRDYNVILFSSLASSSMTLIGYFIADLTYVTLDPQVKLT